MKVIVVSRPILTWNTLLDNDRVQAVLRNHLKREFGAETRDRYFFILEKLYPELG